MLDIIVLLIGVLYLAIGSYTDIKTMEVPDWLNFSLIGVGLGIRCIMSLITMDPFPILFGLAGLGIFVLISLAMYYTGQWGGGDAKLLMGLGVLLGFDFSWDSTLIRFFLYLLLAGAAYGMLWGCWLAWKHRVKLSTQYKKSWSDPRLRMLRTVTLILSIGLLAISFFVPFPPQRVALISLAVLIVSTLYIWIGVKAVEKVAMLKRIKPQELTEGDWIAKDVMVDGKRICGPKDLGIEKDQIARLIKLYQKKRISTVLVKHGVPFVPSFLLAFILTFTLPNPLFLLWG
ncbi:MAG: prepilin peptidase [archaeon]